MNKAEKIRKEIERLKAETFDNKELSLEEIIAARNCYNNILFFINSLEEPVKRTTADIESAMQEVEDKSKAFTAAHPNGFDISFGEADSELSNDLEEAARKTGQKYFPNEDNIWARPNYEAKKVEYAFKEGAQWQKANLWKDAQGDDLPEIDREVIVLVKSLPEYEDSLLKVSFAHRPPEYWMGKNIGTGEITRHEPKRYDKGGWNQPNVVYWLDVELPKEEE